jgi:hypothetical protein
MSEKRYLSERSREILELIENGEILGGCLNTVNDEEKEPTYQKAEAETVLPVGRDRLKGMNSRIIFGKDRLGSLASGFGGNGNPASNSIDIVVGMASSYRRNGERLDQNIVVDKNIFTDAARIYISQRTNLDKNFGITEGTMYDIDAPGSNGGGGVSGIGVKADTVLIVGRRNVKIKAGQSEGTDLPKGKETDAHGRKIESYENKIELIGSSGMSLEPVVLGDRLTDYLKETADSFNKLNIQLQTLMLDVVSLKIQLLAHIHGDPISGVTLPSPDLAASVIDGLSEDIQNQAYSYIQSLNSTVKELNALEIPNNTKYILSKNVFTT